MRTTIIRIFLLFALALTTTQCIRMGTAKDACKAVNGADQCKCLDALGQGAHVTAGTCWRDLYKEGKAKDEGV